MLMIRYLCLYEILVIRAQGTYKQLFRRRHEIIRWFYKIL